MKNNILIWIIGIVLVLLAIGIAGVVAYQLWGQKAESPRAAVEFPTGTQTGNGGATLTLGTTGGSSVASKDFIHNGETVADTQNPGTYVLAGTLGYCLADGSCPAGAQSDDFSISYFESDQSFYISLLKEPIGAARKKAQDFLQTAWA